MGRDKEARIRSEDGWMIKARSEGMICAMCGMTPPYGSREIYFETGMCGHCAHQMAKDD